MASTARRRRRVGPTNGRRRRGGQAAARFTEQIDRLRRPPSVFPVRPDASHTQISPETERRSSARLAPPSVGPDLKDERWKSERGREEREQERHPGGMMHTRAPGFVCIVNANSVHYRRRMRRRDDDATE